jgi:hypothetical protein
VYGRGHNVWETSVWAQVSGRRIVRRSDGHFRLVPGAEVLPTDFLIYDRGDPQADEQALREALPALYVGFQAPG